MKAGGIDLCRIGGIQIAIHPSWIIIFSLVCWSLAAGYFPQSHPGYGRSVYLAVGFGAALLFFASVVAHELAHSLVANRSGQSVKRITLFLFGGVAHLSQEPSTPSSELRIAAAGPLSSLVLAALFWMLGGIAARAGISPLPAAVFQYLAVVNVALALFNLLPGLPLDGGRVLRALLWRRSGDLRRATARAAQWGGAVAFALMGFGFLEIMGGALLSGLWLIFIAMFLSSAARNSYRHMLAARTLDGTTVREVMVSEPVTVSADLSVGRAIDEQFLRHGFGSFPVEDHGRIEGLLSFSQIRDCPAAERSQRQVREIMRPTEPGIEIPATASLSDALERMTTGENRRLLVTDGGRVVGLLTLSGLLRFIQLKGALDAEAPA